MEVFLEDLPFKELQRKTKKEICERLDELEVPHDPKWRKDELIDLLRAEGGQFDDREMKGIEPESYTVVHDFKDLQDKGFVYFKGDKYPRKANKSVTEERVKELLGTNNKIGKQLIKE